uniref:Uncharacterized protein n=1 Tax=Florenciella sp. virus SA2 TaxID=3240092 RepID=A0AB39JFT1_9VIRU
MNQFNEIFFSSLSKDYCIYFYILSLIFFISLVMAVGCCVYKFFLMTKKKCSVSFELYNVFMLGLLYFQNRLLYSMCMN